MKVYVRSDGGELACRSFGELQELFRLSLVGEDDLVRREGSERWVRAGDLPELRRLRQHQREERHFLAWALLAALLVTLAMVLAAQLQLRTHPHALPARLGIDK